MAPGKKHLITENTRLKTTGNLLPSGDYGLFVCEGYSIARLLSSLVGLGLRLELGLR